MRSPFLTLVLCAATVVGAHSANAQKQAKPLFTGEEALAACVVEIPLTYSPKDKERYTQAAKFVEDQELVLVTADRMAGTVSYQRVYVVVDDRKDGTELVYVEHAADRMRSGGMKEAWFPRIKPATQRFYDATCFDKVLEATPALAGTLKDQSKQ